MYSLFNDSNNPTASVIVLALLVVAALWFRKHPALSRLDQCLTEAPSQTPAPGSRAYFLVGLLLTGSLLVFKELRYKGSFFLDDDNLSQFLPVILRGCEHFFKTGHLPTWNPYSFLGTPTLGVGTYALTYPFTYVSYAVAAFGLHQPTRTFEVFCSLHLLAGYWATFALARRLGLRPLLALCVALGWGWCSYRMLCAWYYIAPVQVYLPLLFLILLRWEKRGASWRSVGALALVLGLFASSGNLQMWSYALLFCGIFLAVRVGSKQLAPRRAALFLPALLLGLAIAAPGLIPTLVTLADMERKGADGTLLPLWELPRLFFFFPLLRHPRLRLTDPANPANFEEMIWYWAALPLVSAALWLGLYLLLRPQQVRWSAVVRTNPWLILGLIALVLSLGNKGGLWAVLAALPKFNQFQHAGKFLLFAIFFLSLAGAQAVEQVLGQVARPRIGALAVAVSTLAGLFWWTLWPHSRLYADGGYPALPEALAAKLTAAPQGRVLSIAPSRSGLPNYAWTQVQGFSPAYRLLNVSGYDPLVAKLPETLLWSARFRESQQADQSAGLKAMGVRWILFSHQALVPGADVQNPKFYPVSMMYTPAFIAWVNQGTTLRLRTEEFSLFELTDPAPLAFAETALPVSFDEEGTYVALPEAFAGGPVTVTVLARAGLSALADGVAVPLQTDSWGRCVVTVPANTRQLALVYPVPWQLVLSVAAALALCSLLLCRRLLSPQRQTHSC